MCGRFSITSPPEAVRNAFDYVEQPNFPPRFNIAPTQPVPIVHRERAADGRAARHFRLVRWGLVPAWAKQPEKLPLMINARIETALQKPSFRAGLTRRRCLFVMDAFYEWRRTPGPKATSRPFMIRDAGGRMLGVAGIWENWLGADGSEMDSACLLTTAANGAMAAVHDRMPVILDHGVFEDWLDVDRVPPAQALALARPPANDALEFVPIGNAVNKVANDGPEVQAPAGEAAALRDGRLF